MHRKILIAGWSSPVARQAHNLKVVGSNPTPATNLPTEEFFGGFFIIEAPPTHRNRHVCLLYECAILGALNVSSNLLYLVKEGRL